MSRVIKLADGGFFDLKNPGAGSPLTIQSAAVALSNICRFTGHVSRHYSVAQHSIVVALLVPEHLRYQALLHDITEAVLGDVASPLKALLPDYKEIEQAMYRKLAVQFGLPPEEHPLVKAADRRALDIERRLLQPLNKEDYRHYDAEYAVESNRWAEEVAAMHMTPAGAAASFLAIYERYKHQHEHPQNVGHGDHDHEVSAPEGVPIH